MTETTQEKGATACAGRAAREAAAQPPHEAAPLHPSGFAVAGRGDAGDGEGTAGGPACRPGQPRRDPMSAPADAELELFRQSVNCAAVLERMMGGWKLDVRESTKRSLKYRRGPGEIIRVHLRGHA